MKKFNIKCKRILSGHQWMSGKKALEQRIRKPLGLMLSKVFAIRRQSHDKENYI